MKPERRNLFILFFTLIVIMLGLGIIIPILPFYIDRFGAGGKEMGFLMSSFAITQFLFAPFWGQLSERVGRKPILMIGILGNGIAMLMFGLSTELWMLYASRALAGVLSAATLPTAMAYVGDTTSAEDRGGGMGLMGAAMGIGMVLGPGLGGWLGADSLSLPFFLAAGLSFLALLFVLGFLPESLSPEVRLENAGKGKRPSQFRLLRDAIFSPIGILLGLAFLLSFGLTNFEAVFGLWALDRFGFGTREVGIILTVIGLSAAVVQGGLTGPATKRWGEPLVIKASFLGAAAGFVLLLLTNSLITVILASSVFVIFKSAVAPGHCLTYLETFDYRPRCGYGFG
ncbi:MAG: TCR/Tet family MFS transporter [Chloroflexi bacterium]|nr:TCR/Tet family MFS transporter [Chloroflexota bacterium]